MLVASGGYQYGEDATSIGCGMTLAICSCRAAPSRLIIEPTCPFHGDDPFMSDLPDDELECLDCGTLFTLT